MTAGRDGAVVSVNVGTPRTLRPDHGLTVGDVARACHADRSLVPRLVEVPELPGGWRDWASRRLARAAAPPARRRA